MADDKKPAGDSEEKILERARKRWKIAEEAERDNRDKEASDLKFAAASPDDNWQWPEAVRKQREDPNQEGGPRPCLTINPLPQHIRQVTNEQRQNRPQIRYMPVDSKADVKTAKVLNGIVRHIQVSSEADLAYDTACDYQVAGGEGFFRVLTEYCDERSFDQDIVIRRLADRFKVYLDPLGLMKHPAGRMCEWGFIVEDLPKHEYEAQYGDVKQIDWNLAGLGDMVAWFPDKNTVRIAEYFEIDKKKATLIEYTRIDGSKVTALKDEPIPDGVVPGGPTRERSTSVPQCIWRKINGQHVLSEQEMPTKYIPIVRVVGNEWVIDGKPVVSGLTRNAKDAVRMYNYNRSMEAEQNSLAPKQPFVGMAEQFAGYEDRWKNANTTNYAFLPYNPVIDEATGQIINVAPPQRMQPAMPQAAFIAASMRDADDIKKTTGQYDPTLGNNPQAKSGIALQREQVKSEVGTFHYQDNLKLALRYAGVIILDMLPRVMTGKRVQRILGEDGKADYVTLDASAPGAYQETEMEDGKKEEVFNLAVGKYDVEVSTGPSFTTQRQEASEFLTNAIQSAKDPAMAGVLTYLALKSNDWAGAEEATEMVKKLLPPGIVPAAEGDEQPEELPPEVMQAMQQLKEQLGQAMGQADAAKQALVERDTQLKEAKGQLAGKNVDAMAKMYEADKKALAEITQAQADVITARTQAVIAAQQQPENQELGGLVTALGHTIAEMQGKIDALTQSAASIAEQLQTFEISARMPNDPGAMAA